jgi:hypothetical protein
LPTLSKAKVAFCSVLPAPALMLDARPSAS